MRSCELVGFFVVAALMSGVAQPGFANEQKPESTHVAEAATTKAVPEPDGVTAGGDETPEQKDGKTKDLFCESIVDEAREQRYYLIEKRLTLLLLETEKRMAEMRAKKGELEAWVQRREAFAEQASGKLVEIYGGMKPEASAARLEKLDTGLAASLLLAISPRQAGVILNEMDEKIAADITAIMAASARRKDPS